MSRIQSSTEKYFNKNIYFDFPMDLNKCNDVSINSNYSSVCNRLPRILKMYARELNCSSDEHKSDGSHIRSENLLNHRTEHISDNTYLTSIHHVSDAITSHNENFAYPNSENLNCYNSSLNNNICGIENRIYSSCLTSSILVKHHSTENLRDEERNKGVNYQEGSYNVFDNQIVNSTNNENNSRRNNNQFSTVKNGKNEEFDIFFGNNSSYDKGYVNTMKTSSNCLPIKNSSKNEYNLCNINNCRNDKVSSPLDKSCVLLDVSNDPKTTNKYEINYSTAIPHPECIAHENANSEKEQGLNKLSHIDAYKVERISVSSGDEMHGSKKVFNTNLGLLNEDNLALSEIACNSLGDGLKRVKKYNSEQNYNFMEEKKDRSDSLFNKKLKSYSLDDIKKGKVEIPSVIFIKLPFNSNGSNVIDSYRRNNKLLNFMKDCNDSVGLILKYPQIEKIKNITFKVPSEIAPAIRRNIGSSIIYEDKFDRSDYHPNVQNLHMGKIYENHVFSLLKNKKKLGKKLFNKSNIYKKYKYNNNNGFWISNIDKNRLVDPEKNGSYITELVYEKNNSYDEEVKTLMHCKGHNVIPPIEELYKDNNFYLFLQKEKMYHPYFNPVMATTMRRYDVEGVSDYKYLDTCECITPFIQQS
ncbi:hypothetical protein, conserved [Plasmodium gonderi]|uniref:Uncharacterized protein n=1 Tax=Plasmodium gonderi TaxID=77519 RepID=A0A1Y1JLG4_PLAGO|nr:hypothetical protein, conserved [Plasmodium gonderi]GAW83396.1 hypothetical protein, conserved [Plasmodium gonderi]